MDGWLVPPPRKTTKSRTQLQRERRTEVDWLIAQGLLKSQHIKQALLQVPLPLPGLCATTSCPHGYPLFDEPLALGSGHRFMEIGLAYSTALALEVVRDAVGVIDIEIDPVTFDFAKGNLAKT